MEDIPSIKPDYMSEKRFLTFHFTGNGKEYFNIWIVNTLLTIVTLGIYSAWAKVRKNQYFYTNTHLDNSSFEYLARPIPILIGRIIAVVMFAVAYFSYQQVLSNPGDRYWVSFFGITVLVIALMYPWILVKAASFRAKSTAYRGIRFKFKKAYWQVYSLYFFGALIFLPSLLLIFVGLYSLIVGTQFNPVSMWVRSFLNLHLYIILTILFLLMLPVFWRSKQQFLINNLSLGTSRFRLASPTSKYYALALSMIGVGILLGFFNKGGEIMTELVARGAYGMGLPTIVAQFLVFLIVFVVTLVSYIVITNYFKIGILNIIWNHAELRNMKFHSRLTASEMIAIMLKNTFLIIVTLGIYTPWAAVNIAKYRLDCLGAVADGELETFVNEEIRQQESAIGEGMTDAFEFDLGI